MAHCDKCDVDFDENNAEEAAQHKHEEAAGGEAPAGEAPAEETPSEGGETPQEGGAEEPKTE